MPVRPGYPKQQYTRNDYAYTWNAPNGQGGYNPSTTYFHTDIISGYQNRIGWNTPGWPAHIQTNPYDAVYYSRRDSNTHYSTTLIYPYNEWYGYGHGDVAMEYATGGFNPGDETGLDTDAMTLNRDLCLAKIMGRIKNQRVNLAQAFMERKQLESLVVSTARRIAGAYTALRRGRFDHAVKSLTGVSTIRQGYRVPRGIPQQWLELQYAWKPLLSDVYGTVEMLSETLAKRPPIIMAKASASNSLAEVTTGWGKVHGPTWPNFTAKRRGTINGTMAISYTVTNDFVSVISRTGISNPLQVAWELVPYSFVVDWFLPIGTFLSNLDYNAGLEFLGGWYAYKRGISWSVSCDGGAMSDGVATQTWSGGSIDITTDVVHREGFSSFPSVPLPHFKDPFSPTHVANALSLLATAFGRRSGFKP